MRIDSYESIMTTGSRTVGTYSKPFFYQKVWSGSDNKYANPLHRKRGHRSDSSWNFYSMTGVTVNQSPSFSGYYCGNLGVSAQIITLSANDQVQLQNQLVNAIRGHSFNLGMASAQIDKTLVMATQTVHRFSTSIRLLRRGRVADAARNLGVDYKHALGPATRPSLHSKDVANVWLELQYGWKPFLRDVHDSAEYMASLTNPPRISRLVVSKSRSILQNRNTAFEHIYHHQVNTRRIICEMSESLSVPRSLGLLDPLSVPWDVIPFSFVVDWFVPIGTYLDNYNVIPSLVGRFLTTDRWMSELEAFGFYPNISAGAYQRARSVQLIRTPSTSLAPIKPEFEFPGRSSTGRFWNSLALLTQVVTR